MNKIKNIIFDWGNVLIDVRPENFIEECKKVGKSSSFKLIL
jgi:FMN phosphatase YigB (HAD superfamily)